MRLTAIKNVALSASTKPHSSKLSRQAALPYNFPIQKTRGILEQVCATDCRVSNLLDYEIYDDLYSCIKYFVVG